MKREHELVLDYEADRTHKLRVRFNISEYSPARTYGSPDSWHPAEGGAIEDAEISIIRGERERVLKDSDGLLCRIEREIYDALRGD